MSLGSRDDELRRPSVVAFGVFDGLHRGHQALIARVVQRARESGAAASILTFDPHPALVLSPPTAPLLVGRLDQRLEGLYALGIEQVSVLAFDENSARESATSFIRRVLVERLGVSELVVGDDVHFGHDRKGDVALLEAEGARGDFVVHTLPTYGAPQRYSSTAVRTALRAGDLEDANAVLGRPFVLRATVVHGDARGRELGFPTANLGVSESQILPARGIYAAGVRWDQGDWRCGAVSVGTRPQFYAEGGELVEVHLPDFEGDLYDAQLDVAFLRRLRPESTFASLEELVTQMQRDVEESRDVFAAFTPSASVLLR